MKEMRMKINSVNLDLHFPPSLIQANTQDKVWFQS